MLYLTQEAGPSGFELRMIHDLPNRLAELASQHALNGMGRKA